MSEFFQAHAEVIQHYCQAFDLAPRSTLSECLSPLLQAREMGLRLALGARRPGIAWLLISSGARPVLLGLAAGLLLGLHLIVEVVAREAAEHEAWLAQQAAAEPAAAATSGAPDAGGHAPGAAETPGVAPVRKEP